MDEIFWIATILILGFTVSVTVTGLLVPVVRSMALRREWVDVPDMERKVHSWPIPRVGGLAIAAGFGAGLVYALLVQNYLLEYVSLPSLALGAGALGMVCAGFYDDVHELGFKRKFAVQIVVAYVLILAGYRIEVAGLPFVGDDVYQHAMLSFPLTMLWIVGVINAVNLIDGLDGLSGGVVLIAFLCLAAIFAIQGQVGLALIAFIMSGAITGFLIYNFNPASIFMGDSGSLFLGLLLAAYSLSGQTHSDPLVALLILPVALGLPILDTTLSIVRRVVERKAICAPDRDHIHHRLMALWPTRKTVLVLYGVALWFGMSAVLMALSTPIIGLILFTSVILIACSGVILLNYSLTLRSWGTAHFSHTEAGDGGGGNPALRSVSIHTEQSIA